MHHATRFCAAGDQARAGREAVHHERVEARESFRSRGSTGGSPWRRCGPGSCRTSTDPGLAHAEVLGDILTVTADHGQWFAEDPEFRLFAPELGGGALLDLGVYPVSFASMVLGTPDRIVAMSDPAFTGVDGQTSMLFGYDSGAQAVLTCTLRAESATRHRSLAPTPGSRSMATSTLPRT